MFKLNQLGISVHDELLRGEVERLKREEYDDSPWAREEIQALAWQAAEHTNWDEYDDVSGNS